MRILSFLHWSWASWTIGAARASPGSVWLSFLRDVLGGTYRIEHPTSGDLRRCEELQSTYADLAVGVVDASVLAVVERFGETKLATLDHRHFGTMRPRHVEALELLPVGG